MKHFFIATLGLWVLLAAIPGHAQGTPSATETDPVLAADDSQAPQEAPPPEEDDSLRLRFGFELGGAIVHTDLTSGLGAELTLRLGVQFSRWLGLYYAPSIVLGGWLSDDAAGLLFNWHNAAILEVTLPILHIGLGPSFDRVSIAHFAADPMTTPQSTTDLGFGLDGRVAIVLGGSGPGPHGGLSINLHPHVTFVRGAPIATVMLALGGELY